MILCGVVISVVRHEKYNNDKTQGLSDKTMCVRIKIEDLAANAILELFMRAEKKGVRFDDLRRYGDCVVKILEESGEDAILMYSRESRQRLFSDYSAFFEPIPGNDGWDGIRLRDGVAPESLWYFRLRITARMLQAFCDNKAYEELIRFAA